LCGGPEFGRREYDIALDEAKKTWAEFLNFFDESRILYNVSLGDTKYVFQGGILIVDKDKSGVLNVVQDD